jgi:protein ImuA
MSCLQHTAAPEDLHPSLWRASQLAHAHARCVDTGHPALSKQLPGGGWPTGTLIDLLPQQPGNCFDSRPIRRRRWPWPRSACRLRS